MMSMKTAFSWKEQDMTGQDLFGTTLSGVDLKLGYGAKDVAKSVSGGSKGGGGSTSYTPCYKAHPPLKIGEWSIYGGNCATPVVLDADIYIGLDYSMAGHSSLAPMSKARGYMYLIRDMNVPKNPDEFKAVISWLADEVTSGKKVHIGCIGGHGRTGMVLAALVAHMLGEKDAIQYVRKNYCEKAVESSIQVEFLAKHFGTTKVACSKGHGFGGVTSVVSGSQSGVELKPIASNLCIWGKK